MFTVGQRMPGKGSGFRRRELLRRGLRLDITRVGGKALSTSTSSIEHLEREICKIGSVLESRSWRPIERESY